MAGRPRTYDPAASMDIICEELANSDRSMWEICEKDERLPLGRQVSRWIAEDEALRQKYARAKELQADYMAAQIRAIADECRVGEKTKILPDGKTEVTTGDMVERSRLQIDARKWLAGKLAPKKYGEKIQQEHTGADGGPIVVHKRDLSESELMAIAASQ